MHLLLFIPVVLSLVVLGAHFLRDGFVIGVAGVVALLGLLFLRRAWVPRVMQMALLVGAFEWVLTLYSLADSRLARGESVTRMAIILGSVAAVSLVSAYLFETRPLQAFYGLDKEDPTDA